MATAHVALGANLGDPRRQVLAAMDALAACPGVQVQARSALYLTPPWGDTDQPPFVNAAVRLETRLEPLPLLDVLLDIERRAGRTREGRRWGPRVLDLDLLVYEDRVLDEARLQLPHPRIAERAFVLLPLADLDGALDIPGQGRVAQLLARVDTRGCRRLAPAAEG